VGPVGTGSTEVTLGRRGMENPSKGHDLSLYAMLFQELTANWFDPQTCLPGANSSPADNIPPAETGKQRGCLGRSTRG